MKKKFHLFIIILSFTSCYYDSEEALFPKVNFQCDTTNITFSVTIETILSNNCWSCHSNSNAPTYANGIKLQDYSDVVNQSNRILGAIEHKIGPYMPPPNSAPMIDSCSINQFNKWVRIGSKPSK